MGSGFSFYTYQDAAKRLKCSRRTLYNHINRGFLKPIREGKSVVLQYDDVEQLAEQLGTDLPALNKKTLYELMMVVKKLQQDMTVMRRILDIREEPLRFDKPGPYVDLHSSALVLLQNPDGIERRMILAWCNIFDRMDEVTLRQLASAIPTPHPWKVFYELILVMMEKVSGSSDPDDQLLHKKLDEGRKKLRGTILMWIELGSLETPKDLLKSLSTPKEVLASRLALKTAKSS